jgi:hypothetical protein
MEIIKIEMKEIHSFIGNKLKENLSKFNFNKTKKLMERDNTQKIDLIRWYAKKYNKNEHLLLSFTSLIRHKMVDGLYEKLFGCKFGTENMIWFNYDDDLYGKGHTSFDIKTMDDLKDIMDKTVKCYKNEGEDFFNQFNSDSDFYKYTCVDKKDESWSENPALKRIMLCYIIDKSYINEIHKYNIKCCTSVPSGTDYYIKKYNDGIKILNKYYGEELFE